ncbi:hypothetical protein [Rufibacter sp. LB8]|uniref:hypothetical protein n=1 Tax=Rufibacter sp. LB8 TaxID=2777781 RepID=UPI00178C810C|nr:hypothetical protein [Rufibacter sp. LB8]
MKTSIFAFFLFLSVVGTSFAGTNTSSPVSVARELSVVLQLNESQYLRVKSLVNARQEEEKAGRTSVQEINEKFSAAIIVELSPAQQEMFKQYLASGAGASMAVFTK